MRGLAQIRTRPLNELCVCLSCLDPVQLSIRSCFLAALVGVGSGETETDPALVDLKDQAAETVVVRESAQIRIFLGVSGQAILEIRVVRLDLRHGIGLVEEVHRLLLLFLQTGSHGRHLIG